MANLTFNSANTIDVPRADDAISDAIATPGDFKAIQVKVDGYASDTTGSITLMQLNSMDNTQFDSELSATHLKTLRTERDKPIIHTVRADTRGVSHIKLLVVNGSGDQVTVTGVI